MARRAHGRAVRVSGGVDALLAAAATEPGRARRSCSRAPTTPPASCCRAPSCARLLDGLPDGRGGAARRGARGVRRRAAHERLARAARGAPAAARLPQLLQGLGPRGPAHRLCDRRPRRRRSCWPSSSPTSASRRSRRRARSRRCTAARSWSSERVQHDLRGAPLRHQRAARARLRRERQPGELRVGRPPRPRRRRARRAPGPRRRARGGRRRARRAPPRAHRACARAVASERLLDAVDKALER